MNVNIMTWNTRLYEYGNKVGIQTKEIDADLFASIIKLIDEHLERENAIAILQEVPYWCNITWKKHELFKKFEDHYTEDQYTVIYNISSQCQIMMTIVIAKKGVIEFDDERIKNKNKDYCNRFVSFKVKNADLYVLAVHQKDNVYASDKLNKDKPNIILGDFNAGDYTKENESDQFQKNRDNYKTLLAQGYTDICDGQITTDYETPIDHILIDDKNVDKVKKLDIVRDGLSDHYRITLELK